MDNKRDDDLKRTGRTSGTGTLETDPFDSGTAVAPGSTRSTGTAVQDYDREGDANRDPLTGTPGSHPVGTGVGATGGAVAGAAIGVAVGGPVGAVVGGAVGAIVGGLAGHGIAEGINPTAEDAYWRENYSNRDYVDRNRTYDDYQPAYRYGWESRGQHAGRQWNEAESDLQTGWNQYRGSSNLDWNQAKPAARDAWDRIDRNLTADDDTYWRENYRYQSYADRNRPYEDYEPAYRYGRESYSQYRGRRFEDVENDLERGWENAKGASKHTWYEVKDAVRDAWRRAERALPGDADRDGR